MRCRCSGKTLTSLISSSVTFTCLTWTDSSCSSWLGWRWTCLSSVSVQPCESQFRLFARKRAFDVVRLPSGRDFDGSSVRGCELGDGSVLVGEVMGVVRVQ